MKKKYVLGVKVIVMFLIAAAIIMIDGMQKQEEKMSDVAVILRAYVEPYSIAEETEYEGWFGDLLKEKLDIEVLLEPFPVYFGSVGWNDEGFIQDADLYVFLGEISYYDAVKEGKLKNLEDDIKKHLDVYSKYTNAINRIKEDTYDHTGKKGVYGMPIWLESFDDTGRDCYCISVLSDAKNPEKAMDLITYSASEEGIMNIAFGPEGQMWKQENGKYVLIQDWYEDDWNEKFIETKNGKENRDTAACRMQLVGNEMLARELIGNTQEKNNIPVTDRQEDNWQNHLGKLDVDAGYAVQTDDTDAIAISSEDSKYTVFVRGEDHQKLYIYNTEEEKLDQIDVTPDLATDIMTLEWIGQDKVAVWSHVNPSIGCLDIYDVNSLQKLAEKYCSIYSLTEEIDTLVYVQPAPHFSSAMGEEKILNMDDKIFYQTGKNEVVSSIDINDNGEIAIVIEKKNINYESESTNLVVLKKKGKKYKVKEKIALKRREGEEINWINNEKILYSTRNGGNKVKDFTAR